MNEARSGPLAGIRVLEVGHILAGPFAAMVLADLGADVVKIESAEGDLSRQVAAPFVDGHNAYFASINRNKRSVAVDLSTDEGQRQLGQLAATAHALIVNLRPSVVKRLGLDYESLRVHNEKIVCVAITGFGLDGPGADWPAFDYVVQAMAGVAALTGEPDGPPALAGYSAVDNSAALMAACALLAKIVEGHGGQVDVSLFDTMLAQLNYKAADHLNGGAVPARRSLGAHSFYAPAQLFETADGYLALFVSHDEMWRTLCSELGAPEWADDPRYATMHARAENRAQLLASLRPRLEGASAREWTDRLRPLGIPVGPVLGLDEALDSELVRSRGMVVALETAQAPLYVLGNPVVIDGERGTYRLPPRLHEHTDELLRHAPRGELMAQVPVAEGIFTMPSPDSAQPQLIGGKCGECGLVTFPRQHACARCSAEGMTEFLLPREGRLWAWTTQDFPPPSPPYSGASGDEFVPYGVGFVELPDTVKVESRLTVADPDVLRNGMAMRLVLVPFRTDDDGNEVMTFAFEPVG